MKPAILVTRVVCSLIAGTVAACAGDGIDVNVKGLEPVHKAAEELKIGLDQVDPLALKELVRTNEELRSLLEEVRVRLESLPHGRGVIVLKDHQLYLRVSHYTGAHIASCWIDYPQNWVWQDRSFLDQKLTLQVSPQAFLDRQWQAFRQRIMFLPAQRPGNWDGNIQDHVGTYNATEVLPAFERFLKSAPLVPGPDTRDISLGESVGQSGNHIISIVVTPVAYDPSERWSFRGQIVSVAPSGAENLVKEFDLTSNKYPEHLGKPLPTVQALITVETTRH